MKSFIERHKEKLADRIGPAPIIDPAEYKRSRPQKVITGYRIEPEDIDALNAQINRDNCPF